MDGVVLRARPGRPMRRKHPARSGGGVQQRSCTPCQVIGYMRAPLVGVVGLIFLVSGCVTETDGTAKDENAVENTGELKLKPIAEPQTPEVRSTAAPPKWRQGEWWTYELTDAFTGQTYRFTRVVAGIEGD